MTCGEIVTDKIEKEPCCAPGMMSCCKVESIVSVDERGQNGAPKDLRGI